MIDFDERIQDLTPRGWTVLAAAAFGLGGMTLAILVPMVIFPPLLGISFLLVPGAMIGGAVFGGPLWWLFIEVRQDYATGTGLLVGALTAIPSPYVAWAVVFLWDALGTRSYESLPGLIRAMLSYVWSLGGFSLLLTWFLTLPAGGFIGVYLAYRRRLSIEKSESEGGDDATTE